MRKVIYCILTVLFIAVAGFLYLLRPNVGSLQIEKQIIAHAGGRFQGHNYTNSLEAVENAIRNGVQYIELDLSITSDSQLVCTHDWETYAKQVGLSETIEIPCFSEFEQSRLFSCLTPMTMHLIDSVWTANPNLYLVTDKISDFETIDKNLGKYKERMLVECFSYEDYVEFVKAGYYRPMLSVAPQNYLLLRQRIYQFRKDPEFIIPDMFVVDKHDLDKQYEGWNPLKWLENTSYAAYTARNRQEADSMFKANDQIRLIYVDDIE